MLDQVAGTLASFTGDGGYDQERIYASVAARHPEAAVIVPPRVTAVPSERATTEPTQRDRHLQLIAAHGRMGWQKMSGYTKRARAEAAIARWKQVIGDGLRSRTDERRATEVAVAAHALNRIAGAGTPELCPHRLTPDGVGVAASTPLIRAPCQRTLVLGKAVEPGFDEHRLQAIVEGVTRGARQLGPTHQQLGLPLRLPTQRHTRLRAVTAPANQPHLSSSTGCQGCRRQTAERHLAALPGPLCPQRLAHRAQRAMVAAAIRTAFAQETEEMAHRQ